MDFLDNTEKCAILLIDLLIDVAEELSSMNRR